MRPISRNIFHIFISVFFLTAIYTISHEAYAAAPQKGNATNPTEHEIKQGETLGQIAAMYNISLSDLMALNSLENADKIFFGQKLKIKGDLNTNSKHGTVTKQGVKVTVPKGFTLSRIAAAYGVSTQMIVRANRMKDPNRLREGDILIIPGVKNVIELVPPPPCYKNPVTLYRVRTDETLELPLEFCSGKPNVDGLQQLSDFTRSIARPTDINFHPRIMSLLQKVADHYPGKRIEIISGQRAQKENKNESYHTKGQAVDFRVEGVSNLVLVNYVRTFENVGVGYYPNSVFIHLDTREKSAYWVDYSGPGEKAVYARQGLSKEEVEELKEKRKAKKGKSKTNKLSAENDKETTNELQLPSLSDMDLLL